MLAAVCVGLPLVLAASRAWGARRGRVEFGLLRHPLSRRVRPHLVQGFNIWLCCALLGGVVAVGGTQFARIAFSLTPAQYEVVFVAFAAGLILLAALAVVPRRRVYLPTNVVVALLSGFLAVQLGQVSARAHRCASCSTRHWPASGSCSTGSQRPAQRSLPEREQRCRLPASRGQWADAPGRKRRPADRLRRLRVACLGAGRRPDRRGDRRLRRHPAGHQRRPRQLIW